MDQGQAGRLERIERHGKAYHAAQRHAKHCHECYMPIVDDEGNPQYVGEACIKGAKILKEYIAAEQELRPGDYSFDEGG